MGKSKDRGGDKEKSNKRWREMVAKAKAKRQQGTVAKQEPASVERKRKSREEVCV